VSGRFWRLAATIKSILLLPGNRGRLDVLMGMFLQYFLAALPVLALLGLMIGPRWGAHKAGPAAWLAAVMVSGLAFGLTPSVFWVSQARGALLSLYVLAVLWPALLLYNVIDRAGGIRALGWGLERAAGDRGLLALLLAWAFSAFLEGMAGFGLPVAVVSPMLAAAGVSPVMAVAAVAIGHAWSVTFGDMGVIFGTLTGLVQMEPSALAHTAALMMAAACLLCGLATIRLLGLGRLWKHVLVLGLLMSVVQYGLATAGLAPLAGMAAGLAGVAGGVLAGMLRRGRQTAAAGHAPIPAQPEPAFRRPLVAALAAYGGLALLMTLIVWPGPVRAAFFPVAWQPHFPEVVTRAGFVSPAGAGQAFRFLMHPGSSILLVSLLAFAGYRRVGLNAAGDLRAAALATWRAAAPASLGIAAAVGLSTMMEYTGMTQLLARGLAFSLGEAFPLVSPLVGMLGAFATGSNNNSNVLFAPLQYSVAGLLQLDPGLLLSTQTAGGALGSMIAPAKIAVGCSTTGLKGREGDVLRRTLPVGLVIGLLLGLLALFFAR
jgi:lactate permease